jgi:hypothetical protein
MHQPFKLRPALGVTIYAVDSDGKQNFPDLGAFISPLSAAFKKLQTEVR